MFLNLPNTPKCKKPNELGLQDDEDKCWNSLRWQDENGAIGTVIAEFGNLDELAGSWH